MSNFCTVNPLAANGTTFSEGNLMCTGTGASNFGARSFATMYPEDGKFYWEITQINGSTNNLACIGVCSPPDDATTTDANPTTTTGNQDVALRLDGDLYIKTSVSQDWASATSTGDILMVALDVDNGKVWFGKNGSWFASGDPAGDSNPATDTLTGALGPFIRNTDGTFRCNFGQYPFAYTPPSGFSRLNSDNLTVPSAIDPKDGASPQDYFNTVLYTGNSVQGDGATQSITGVGFQPDFVWIKKRTTGSGDSSSNLFDVVRGAGNPLFSAVTNAEASDGRLTSFDSDGFTVEDDSAVNDNNQSHVAWCWKAGGTAVSNTDGTITSQVSANTDAGFSVVSYTGNGTGGATVGHGLNAAPSVVIIKNRSSAVNWLVLHTSAGFTGDTSFTHPEYYMLSLNTTGAGANYSQDLILNPITDTFALGEGGSGYSNGNGSNYVAYCFAEVEGFSKFGNYTGNGSADGPFLHTGFRPAFTLVKRTDSTDDWYLRDTQRDIDNPTTQFLEANTSNAEGSGVDIDYLSNGFKVRGTGVNASGGTYIYMAFAETPEKYSNGR